MLKQMVDKLPDAVREKAVEKFVTCKSRAEFELAAEQYGMFFVEEELELMSALAKCTVLTGEELEMIAGGKDNFLLVKEELQKG